MQTPCRAWETIETCDRPKHLQAAEDGTENADWLEMVDTATQILWAATGRRFHQCDATERPIPLMCGCPVVCACDPNNPLAGYDYVKLTNRPVIEISKVVFNGVEMDLDLFTIVNDESVLSAAGPFPVGQDLTGSKDDEGSWYIEYVYGKPVPNLGKMAVAELATELGKACVGDRDCALPSRVQNISRQGMSMTMIDPQVHLDRGLWGLTLTDQFISTYNRRRLARAARVFSPDQYGPPSSPRLKNAGGEVMRAAHDGALGSAL